MAFASRVISTINGVPNVPVQFFGRSFVLSAVGELQFDVYNLVRNDIIANMPSGFSTWIYSVVWQARLLVASPNLSLYKTFSGFSPRRNIGIIQYGYPSGNVDDEDWRYLNTVTKYKGFVVNNANIREDVTLPAVGSFPNQVVEAILPFSQNLSQTFVSQTSPYEHFGADTLRVIANFGVSFNYVIRYQGIPALLRATPTTYTNIL